MNLRLPADFDDGLWTAKGYCPNVELCVDGKIYRLTFYEPVRLAQDATAEVEGGKIFFEENLVVVEAITRSSIENAARWLVKTNQIRRMSSVG